MIRILAILVAAAFSGSVLAAQPMSQFTPTPSVQADKAGKAGKAPAKAKAPKKATKPKAAKKAAAKKK